MTCVGSITHGTIRLAQATATNRNECIDINDKHEIVSLVGTFTAPSSEGVSCHLHVSLSDGEGKTIGGHVFELYVFTTAEVVLGTLSNVRFDREIDPKTGFDELVVRPDQ